MESRVLGKDLKVSPVGLGCMGMTHAYGAPADEKEMAKLLEKAVDMGYTFFDTAECYTGVRPDGTTAYNEELVGAALKPYRDKVVIATKCGVRHLGDRLEVDCSPQAIRKAVEGSLRRLQTDHIDLYYQHRVDPKVEPEVVAETMAQFIKEGKIRAWGISAVGEDYLRRANAVCPVTAVQNMYSLVDRDTEKLFPALEELGITLVAFSPLAKGFLSGKYLERPTFDHPEDNRSGRYQFSEEGFVYYQAVLELIRSMAQEKGATMAQIALAWMMCRKPWIVPIPGTRNVSRMEENAKASDITLTPQEVEQIDGALDQMHLASTASRRIR